MTWNDKFLELFASCVKKEQEGGFDYTNGYSTDDLNFLESIGYQKREFYDFVEDFVAGGLPSISTSLLVAAVRRDYFEVVQKGEVSTAVLKRDDLPTFGDELAGFAYLPRILAKARGKLRGELDPDLMYGCGGDRNFLLKNGDIHLADFLRRVWAAGDDDSKIVEWLNASIRP